MKVVKQLEDIFSIVRKFCALSLMHKSVLVQMAEQRKERRNNVGDEGRK
jgi:hypothetical protein